ncbi:alpha/beta hydrolase [Glaciibacter sp. 2TAF33]|uniref:alpha/beta hydrolase n=1 Tax=Glaciibacter sp. 2TAF33 TaxID=3233015 RepID=UPI003F928697
MAALAASLALGGASEASSVPANVTISVSERLPTRTSDRPGNVDSSAVWLGTEPRLAASVDVELSALRNMTGISLLAGLSRLPVSDVSAFVAQYPAQVDALLAAPPTANLVTGWWGGLQTDARAALSAGSPRLVGNLDGIPLRERSRANLRYLGQALDETRAELAAATTTARRGELATSLDLLTQVREALAPGPGGVKRSLVLLDPTDGGRAAIALGNPDTADFVSYLVPGMNYSVHDQIVNWSNTAEALYTEQKAALADLGGTGTSMKSVATISWIGYRAPDLFSVGGLDRAEAGADFLEESWLGIRSARGADQPYISVFAHSYGSTVALVALARGSVEVDALVMVGSPGSALQSAAGLGVRGHNVYVGEADWDPAVNSAFFGSDPGSSSYGAKTLGVSGGRDRVTGARLAGSIGHNEYFKPGSESLRNMALIGTDNAKLATDGSE